MPVESVTAKVGLPFGLGEVSGKWTPDEAERRAAWQMYVELVTRISTVPLGPDSGLLREALTSFYSLFDTTRAILKAAGPEVARPGAHGTVSFAHLAVAILNLAIRPLLAEWHPRLGDHETRRPAEVSIVDWERSWAHSHELRQAIEEVRTTLVSYSALLGDVCEARSLLAVTGQNPTST